MGLLDIILATDAAAFVNTDEFGETVIYKPRAWSTRGVAVRTIAAQVHRESPESAEREQGARVPSLHVLVRNSATTGISSSEINVGGDVIEIAERIGGTAQDHPIEEVLSQDGGMLYLRLAPSR